MAEDKIYRLLTLQQQLLSGNAIDKKAMANRFEVSEKKPSAGSGNFAGLLCRAGQ